MLALGGLERVQDILYRRVTVAVDSDLVAGPVQRRYLGEQLVAGNGG